MRHPNIRTGPDAKNLFFGTISDPEIRSICKTTIACSCHVHAMSDVMHLEAACDTQTFELALMQKICFDSGWGSKGAFGLQDYDTLFMSCASDVRWDAS